MADTKDDHLTSAMQSLANLRMSLRLSGELDKALTQKLDDLRNEILKRYSDSDD